MNRSSLIAILTFISLLVIALILPTSTMTWTEGFWSKSALKHTFFMEWIIPETVMAVIAGGMLAVAGLLLQTLLRNPLAGPSVLGITSGAQLFVAIGILGLGSLNGIMLSLATPVLAGIGALITSILILFFAKMVKSNTSLLIIGMMIGAFLSSITSILITQATPAAVKYYSMWTFGSLKQSDLITAYWIIPLSLGLIIAALSMSKSLNALHLGDNQATYLGINLRQTKWFILILVATISGVITSLCGPIGFVGLIIPNLIRIAMKTGSHRQLIILSFLWGANSLLFCDLLTRIIEPFFVAPINAVTSLFGAPMVLFVLFKTRSYASI